MYLHTCFFRLDRFALLFHWTCSDILSPSPFDLQPELRDTDQFEFAVSLITYEAHRRTERQNASVAALEQEVKVASSSNPGTVAGSIAGRVRSGERCVLAWDSELFCSSLAGVERRITHCKWPVDLVVCFKKAYVNTFRFGLYTFLKGVRASDRRHQRGHSRQVSSDCQAVPVRRQACLLCLFASASR